MKATISTNNSSVATLNNQFVSDIRQIITTAQVNDVRSVDYCRVQMYWHLGKRIFEEEQQGKARADYGSYLIENLAHEIEPEYGSGFGKRQLERARQFYREYPILTIAAHPVAHSFLPWFSPPSICLTIIYKNPFLCNGRFVLRSIRDSFANETVTTADILRVFQNRHCARIRKSSAEIK